MSGIWKNNIGLSIFGESHGEVVGITISNLKPGLEIDSEFIQSELNRRRPGTSNLVTPRNEADKFKIISGVFENKTTGAPLTMIIENTNTRSRDYSNVKDRVRPGHADYPSKVKYEGFSDYRGGGHFSGRLTAGLVFAGAVAKTILRKSDIFIGAEIVGIGKVKTEGTTVINKDMIKVLNEDTFPVVDENLKEKMVQEITTARENHDSVGGKIRCVGINIPVGLGNPFFESFESTLSQLIFSVPAVKGIEFGSGFDLCEMNGSEANDEYYMDGDKVKTYTNHNGGILGGITNGMDIDFSVAIKPTPSIAKKQRTVDLLENVDAEVIIQGRHDPCIVPRAIPVIESVLAITILDSLYSL